MKNYLITSIIVALIFTFSACTEITVTTKVHEDGSFTRIITISGDSNDVFKQAPPYPVDDTWKTAYRKDTTGEEKHILTYSKTYRDSDALNEDIENDTGWYRKIPRHVEIKKKFGFFYSYLTFRETFKHTNPFDQSKDHAYLSKREADFLSGDALPVSKSDSLLFEELEDKATDHLIHLIREEVLKVMDSGMRILDNPQLNNIDLYYYKDSVDYKLDNADIEDLNLFIDYYTEWTGIEAFRELKQLQPSLFHDLNKKWQELLEIAFMDSYTQVVEMPGLITATNSAKIIGNKVSWKMEGYPIMFSDYEMYVESRIVNYWAFVLSGVVLLLLISLLVVKAFRR